jgi:hypothetical protein
MEITDRGNTERWLRMAATHSGASSAVRRRFYRVPLLCIKYYAWLRVWREFDEALKILKPILSRA